MDLEYIDEWKNVTFNIKCTDRMIEQMRNCTQETVELKVNKQMDNFFINPPIHLSEEGKWLSAVTSFEATNSVFNITSGKSSFSISTPGNWNSEDGEELINELNKLLELGSDNNIELDAKEIEKRGIRKEPENSGFNLAGFAHFKSEILAGLKRVKYKDLEGVLYILELTWFEIVDLFQNILLDQLMDL